LRVQIEPESLAERLHPERGIRMGLVAANAHIHWRTPKKLLLSPELFEHSLAEAKAEGPEELRSPCSSTAFEHLRCTAPA
jgi:hypothetical protein